MTYPHHEIPLLLEEQGWLRRLAYSLVKDAALADDAVQDTLLLAVADPLDAAMRSRAARRWLSLTLRGRARNSLRSARLRRDHETAAREGAREFEPGTADLVARAEVSKHLVRHVIELGEPHSSVLLLRYFEGRATGEIAEELSVSNDVVRARLVRAHERLRASLDKSSGGDRSAWVSSLLPLAAASTPASLPTPALAATLMSIKTLSLAGAVLVALLLIGPKWLTSEVPAAAALSESATSSEPLVGPEEVAALPNADAGSRVAQEVGTTPSAALPPAAELFVGGRVLSPDGVGMEGVSIQAHERARLVAQAGQRQAGAVPEVVTESDGTFLLPISSKFWETVLVAKHEGFARAYRELKYLDERPGESASAPPIRELGDVQLEPEAIVEGVVLDLEGRPVAGARIRAEGDLQLDELTEVPPGYSWLRPALAVSGSDGSFRVRGLARSTTHITAHRDEFLDGRSEIRWEPSGALQAAPVTVRLSEAAPATGRVVFPKGYAPEPVSLFVKPSQVDGSANDERALRYSVLDDGTFSLPSLVPGTSYDIGLWTGRWTSFTTDPRSLMVTFIAGDAGPLVLHYREPATVTFRVIDEFGQPIESARIRHWSSTKRRASAFDSAYEFEEEPVWPDGVVTLESLVPEALGGHLNVTVSAQGYTPMELPPIDIDTPGHVDAGTVQLTPLGAVPLTEGAQEAATFTVIVKAETPAETSAETPAERHDGQFPGPLEIAHRWRRPGKGFPGRTASRPVGPDNTLELRGLRPGKHYFRVDARSQRLTDRRIIVPSSESNEILPWTELDISAESPPIMNVEIEPASTVRVRGLLTQAGAPLENAKLLLFPGAFRSEDLVSHRYSRRSHHGFLTPSTGEFTVDVVPEGHWTALVQSPGGRFLHAQPVEITRDSDPLQIDVPRATVKGRVVDRDGQPVSAALLRLAPATRSWTAEYQAIENHLQIYGHASVREYGTDREGATRNLRAADDGRFEIEHVPTGVDWRLWTHGSNAAAGASEPFKLADSEDLDLGDIVVAPGSVLVVRAQPEHRGGMISVAASSGQDQNALSVSKECRGPLTTFKRWPAGTYTVTYQPSSEDDHEPRPKAMTVTLQEGEEVEVSL